MKNIRYYLRYAEVILCLLAFGIGMASAQTAESLLRKSSAAIKGANGLSASFTINCGGKKETGILKSSGSRFLLESTASSTWYDGKTMWIYNPNRNETTLMIPTVEELAESNPLYIVDTYSSKFTPSFAKTQTSGIKTIVLTPKSKKSGYKCVHLVLPNGSSFPSQIVLFPTTGQKITISISKIKTGQKFSTSVFSYPKSKYPKAEIIDLR